MLNIILKIENSYIIWSDKKQHPLTHAMLKEKLFRWIEDNEGQDGVDSFDARIARCDKSGCSSAYHSKSDLILNNKAGDNDESLSEDDILVKYGIHSPHNIKFRKRDADETIETLKIDNEIYTINHLWRISGSTIKLMMLCILICIIIQAVDYFYKSLGNIGIISLAVEMYILGLLSSAKLRIWKKKDQVK